MCIRDRLWGVILLLAMILAGCGQSSPEIDAINEGVHQFGKLENARIVVTTKTHAENEQFTDYDAETQTEFQFVMDDQGVIYTETTTDLLQPEKPATMKKSVYGKLYEVTQNADGDLAETFIDEGDHYRRPDLLTYLYKKVQSSHVETTETVAHPEREDWTGYRIVRNEKYINAVNKSRNDDPAYGLVQDSSVAVSYTHLDVYKRQAFEVSF